MPDCIISLANLLLVVTAKLFVFGQTDLATWQITSDSLLTIPTFELEDTILRSSSSLEEQSDLALSSNGLRHLNKHLRKFLLWPAEAHRLLWPTVLGVLIYSFFLKTYQALGLKSVQEKPAHEEADHRTIIILPEKPGDSKKSDAYWAAQLKLKPLSRNWRFYNFVVSIFLIIEAFFVVFYGIFMVARYTLFDGMADCVMDLQNVTQLRNESYLEDVRNYCGKYGIPPNYGGLWKISSNLFIRNEPRNQTFLESTDYFWGRQRELFNFRISCFFLIQTIVFSEVNPLTNFSISTN